MAVIKLKWSGERQHKGNEGLTTDENGEIIYNDYWLHKEFMENEDREAEDDFHMNKSLVVDLQKEILNDGKLVENLLPIKERK